MFTHDFEAGEIQSMAREDRGNSIYSLPLNGIADNGKGGDSVILFSATTSPVTRREKRKKNLEVIERHLNFPPVLAPLPLCSPSYPVDPHPSAEL